MRPNILGWCNKRKHTNSSEEIGLRKLCKTSLLHSLRCTQSLRNEFTAKFCGGNADFLRCGAPKTTLFPQPHITRSKPWRHDARTSSWTARGRPPATIAAGGGTTRRARDEQLPRGGGQCAGLVMVPAAGRIAITTIAMVAAVAAVGGVGLVPPPSARPTTTIAAGESSVPGV
jgi:hypothetical protein